MSRFVPVLRLTWLVCKRAGLVKDLRHKIVALIAHNQFRWETAELRDERIMQQWQFYEDSLYFREIPKQMTLGNHVEPWENAFYLLHGHLVLHAFPLPRRHRARQWPAQRLYWSWIDAPHDHPFNSEARKLP